jgi:hypothetical protein
LAQGELAVNLADEALYTKDASNAVVKLNAPSIDDKNTGATKHVTIDASGNVGIGTSSPANKLDINTVNNGSPAVRVYGNDQSHNRIRLENIGSGGRIWDIVGGLNGVSNSFFSIYDATAAATRVAIDSSGNLLVGKTSTSSDVTTAGGFIQPTGKAVFTTTGSDQPLVLARNINTGSMIDFFYGGSVRGSVSTNGTTISYNTSSDYRLKHDIQSMTGALAKVAQLKPVTYKWNADDSQSQGFIAHELQEVVPECVTGEKDAVDAEGNPQYQGIDTSFLVATLTAAIQEQQAIITALTARVEALEAV